MSDITGNGRIDAAGKSFDGVAYEISVFVTQSRKSGTGHERFNSIADAHEAFSAGRLTLWLDNDRSVILVPTTWNGFEPQVEVQTSGPVPGF